MKTFFSLMWLACLLCAPWVSPQAQTAPKQQQFIYVLRVCPALHTTQAWTDEDNAAIGQHFERLAKAR
jgi:hypothetical protein